MAIEWKSSLDTQITEIDQQHRSLVQAINQLMEAFIDYTAAEEVRRTLIFLGDYVNTHFTYEEGLMQEAGYPDFKEHRQKHRVFVDGFRRLVDYFKENGATEELARNTQFKVAHWLVNHIGSEDKKMAAWVLANREQ